MRTLLLSFAMLGLSFAAATAGGADHMNHAMGTFEVKMAPTNHAPDGSLGSFTLEKVYHGDFEGTGKGEMLSAGDPARGNAGYVAIERVNGVLAGKQGTFAIMQMATMASGTTPQMQVLIVPGSGTGQLAGIQGSVKILIEGKQHSYEIDYTLGDSAPAPSGTK
jgi:hypothetical protein